MVLLLIACTPRVEETPLEGPGFDETDGSLIWESDQEEFLVGLTHLQVKNAPGPGGTFGEHAEAIGNWLFETEPEGWLGAAFKNRGRLDWWTITVWETEEAMLGFVVSDLHADAMADFPDITEGGESRSLWLSRDELPLDWGHANALLLEDQDFVHGESAWFNGEYQ